MTIEKPKFMPGDIIYIKDKVRSNFEARMNINGKEINKILLQDSYTVLTSTLEFLSSHGDPICYYLVRARYDSTTQIALKDFEILNREEAMVMLKIMNAS